MCAGIHTAEAPGSRAGLVAVAASFGGITATRELFARLPRDFPLPIVLVQHRSKTSDVLACVLQSGTRMRVANAIGGVTPAPGTLYVASSQQQLTFTRAGRFAYANEQANRADTLFRSAAAAYGERVIAVVLTGRLDDGALGVVAVKNAGGRAFAQDRASAAAFSMPGAAIATGCVDYVLPPAAIAAALITLTMLPEAAELFAVSSPPWALSAA